MVFHRWDREPPRGTRIYSQLSLSRPRLSRITAYLEVKILSLFKHVNLTVGNKILWKRGAISPLFHNIINISLTSGVKLHIHLLTVAVRFIVFLNSANLICRGMDISKCFREFLGLRERESTVCVIWNCV